MMTDTIEDLMKMEPFSLDYKTKKPLFLKFIKESIKISL